MITKTDISLVPKFAIVGFCSVAVDFSIYVAMLYGGFIIAVAKSFGVISGFLLGFILNSLWTFKTPLSFGLFIRSLSVNTVTIILHVCLNSLFVWLLGNSKLMLCIAFTATVGITTSINFIFLRSWVYKKDKS